MNLVSQSEFARLCGVSRQAVLKWKMAGRLVLQGNRVDVEATDERMQRYHEGGSPLRRQPVDTVDSRLTKETPVDKKPLNLSTAQRLSDLDGALEFDFSRSALHERIGDAARGLGFEPRFDGDDIELWLDGQQHFVCVGDGFDINAYCALEMLRWWVNCDPIVEDATDPVCLVARPFGSPTTEASCNQ